MLTKRRPLIRRVLLGWLVALGVPGAIVGSHAQAKRPLLEVWKSPACGCCKDWIAYLEREGFAVNSHDEGNTAARSRFGMPSKLGSCHSAVIEGYAIEGHVPAPEIRRLLQERPDAIGLAVPGMPIGSPGMDGPAYGGRRDRYDVLLVSRNGAASVFRTYD